MNDYFRRDSEVRRMAWLMISKGKALQFLKAAPQLERVPTLYLMSTLDQAIKTGKFPTDYIGTFWSNSSKKGQEGFLPYMELKKEQNVEILGLALFKDDKMVGKTAPLEIGAYMGIKGINPAGYRVFISQGAQETVMTVVTFRHSKTEVQIKDNHPHFKITIGLEMNLEEKLTEQLSIRSNGDKKRGLRKLS